MEKLLLRGETKKGEQRTPLTPEGARALIASGVSVEVERSATRIFRDDEYLGAGARLVPAGAWESADSGTLVLGLKELPEAETALAQNHAYFAHCFRAQPGAPALLNRFRRGEGRLWDLEYLTDSRGRRVAAFGYWAGFVGAAVGVLAWCHAEEGATMPSLHPWPDASSLLQSCRLMLARIGRSPRVAVTGHLGRAGRGAVDFLNHLNLRYRGYDQAECAGEGPVLDLLEREILIHCVGLRSERSSLLGNEEIHSARRLRVISDVTCDQASPHHLFPFYRNETTLADPVRRLRLGAPLDVVAIDHLPTLLPRESSEEFSAALLPHLLEFFRGDEAGVWGRADSVFQRHLVSGVPEVRV